MAINVVTSKRTRLVERHGEASIYAHRHPLIAPGYIVASGPYDWVVFDTLAEARQNIDIIDKAKAV